MHQPTPRKQAIFALGLLAGLTIALFGAAGRPAAAAGMFVSTIADVVADDGQCSLREAIIAANTDTSSGATPGECAAVVGVDTIFFSITTPFTITLGSQLPAVTTEMEISGDDADQVIIEASTCNPVTKPGGCVPKAYRVMEVGATGNLTLRGVTVRHGYVDNARLRNGALLPSDGGAGIYNAGTLAVVNSTVANNLAYNAFGGGISSFGPLTISNSTFSGNVGFNGGGVNHSGSTLSVTDSTFSDNYGKGGGAINTDDDDVSVTNSTITGNEGEFGAGIYGDMVTVINSTITDNSALNPGFGGGIYGTIVNVTGSAITGNTAALYGGGIFGGTVNVTDSAVTGNSGYYGGGISGNEVTLTSSTVAGNTAEFGFGGGIYSDAKLTATNSTISGNSSGYGGGFYHNGTLVVTNSTITGNSATTLAGGVYIDGVATLTRNLIAGNSSPEGAEVYSYVNTLSSAASNVYGYDGLTSAQAFVNLSPGVSDVLATSDAGNVALAAILDTTLADNGGPTPTHALPAGSPAIDIGSTAFCGFEPVNGVDQRGQPRGEDGDGAPSADECDSGAFERQPELLGSIAIIMTANPADDQVFSFTDNIVAPNSFTLQNPSNDTKLFSDVAAGTYTVTEMDVPGWPLAAIECNVPVDNVTYDPDGNVPFTFTLPAGFNATCTLASYQCQPGNYDFGGAFCRAAEVGHYVPAVAATESTPCSPGSYQPQEGQSTCLLADPGYYVDVSGSAQQFMCPAGTTSGPGATACTPVGNNFTYLPVAIRPEG